MRREAERPRRGSGVARSRVTSRPLLYQRWAALLVVAVLSPGLAAARAETVTDVRRKMGSRFELKVVHSQRQDAQQAIDAAYREIDRIEALTSSWRESSETSRINRAAGIAPVAVAPELLQLIRRAVKVSELTDGAFDLTFASVGKLWDFKAEEPRLPDPEAVAEALERVGYRHIVVDESAGTVFLDQPGTRIGFGAIGKGYAANRAAEVLKELGVASAVVNAGGDLIAYGEREDGEPWSVGIADPVAADRVFAYVRLSGLAVVTSGDYESFVEIDGRRYAHILDPRTGYPVDHLSSVTIVCADAELADALATATFVLGPQQGMRLVNRLRGVEALMVEPGGKVLLSDNLESLTVAREVAR